jgi:thioredoxin reductase
VAAAKERPVAVIGAGPYGLATAAHLAGAGVHVRVFGEPMESWERHMPEGMLLRSRWAATNIADPDRALGIDRFHDERGLDRTEPIPLTRFVEYGHWFQQRALPQLERRRVQQLTHTRGTFRVALDEGELLEADRVVVAAGIIPFAWCPPQFRGLPGELVSHTADHRSLVAFSGLRVVVVGAGQSALESAALLAEHGADVRVFVRAEDVRWLNEEVRHDLPLRLYAYDRIGIGGTESSWLAARPELFRRLPRSLREPVAYRCIRPAAASWVRPRLGGVQITVGRYVRSAARRNGSAELELDDGQKVGADHVLLATGYRVDLSQYGFLEERLVASIRTRFGHPVLGAGLESSVHGLHFVGAAAADTFGPVMRFVCGTWAAARSVTRQVVGRRAPGTGFSW